MIRFLVEKLPSEFIKPLSDAMMPDLSARLKDVWLDTAVPASLDDMLEYQKSLAQVHEFVEKLESLSWPGGEIFEDWISDAPKIWISKRRETALDWTRNQLALGKHMSFAISTCPSHIPMGLVERLFLRVCICWVYAKAGPALMTSYIGIGIPQSAEHIERQMVGKDEGKQIAASGNMVTQDWDAAWDSEEEESLPLGTNRASLEEARRASEVFSPEPTPVATPAATDDDDAADAWGWGDEDVVGEPISEDVVESPPQDNPTQNRTNPETREVTLSEKYKTSSIPQPVFKTVTSVFSDGARLTSQECVFSMITPIIYLTRLTGSSILQSPPQLQYSSVYRPSFSQCTERCLHIIMHITKVGICKYSVHDRWQISNALLGLPTMTQYGFATDSESSSQNGRNGPI